jgi:small subunit ribosomal protein S1
LNRKIKLGLKQVRENPLEKIESKYQIGQKLNVIVKRVIGTGAYVEIENEKDVEGFIPVQEVSWIKKYRHGKEAFKQNQKLTGCILKIEKERNVIILSLRQLLPNPWNEIREMMTTKKPVECIVKKVVHRGAYVSFYKDKEGFIPLSHFASHKIEEPKKYLKRGQKVNCIIIDVDEKAKRAILSLKEYTKMKTEQEIAQYIKKQPTETKKLGDIIKLE